MPVTIERRVLSPGTHVSDFREHRQRREGARHYRRRVTIGLVNNMPDGAIAATERQFIAVLDAASDDIDVRLRFYALRQVPRSQETQTIVTKHYGDATALEGENLDALIITGAQPIAPNLVNEPYWGALSSLIEWAEANTASTILSCLSAHAGALLFSGIRRRRLAKKCSGVFAFDVANDHRLTQGATGKWLTPQSRYNALDEEELARHGYTILSRSSVAGVDTFVKQMRSLIVFLQGHPEYESDTLAREYRRDMSRHLAGDLASFPEIPHGYFSNEAEQALKQFSLRAQAERTAETMAHYPEIPLGGTVTTPWSASTNLLYRNWLAFIAERKVEADRAFASVAG
jgi:homoserine O-succinyltransferase/O-acetyltransferase